MCSLLTFEWFYYFLDHVVMLKEIANNLNVGIPYIHVKRLSRVKSNSNIGYPNFPNNNNLSREKMKKILLGMYASIIFYLIISNYIL